MFARTHLSVALVLLHVAATLAQFQWNGGNMDFSNGDNWLNRRGPTQTADPSVTSCSTFFGSPNPSVNIISQLTTQVYYVGTNLFLPQNGVLRLALDGTTIAFSTSQDTCNPALPSYNWTGGLSPERRNDFYCHSNWLYNGVPITLDATPDPFKLGTYVPCAGDTVTFSTQSSYNVFIPNNVSLVTLSSVVVDGNSSSSLGSTAAVESQVNFFDTTAAVAFGTSQTLANTCQRYFSFQNRLCQCYSTCFPPNYQALVVAQVKGLQSAAAQRQAQIDSAVALRRFIGTFLPSSLGLSASQVADNVNNATQNSVLVAEVTAALYLVPASNVSGLTLTLVNGNAVLSGNINTTNAALYLAGSIAIAPNPVTWTAVGAPGNVTQLQYIAQSTLGALMAKYIAIQLQEALNNQVNNLDPDTKNVINTLATLPNSTALLQAANNDPCFSSCISNCSDCVPDLTNLFQSVFGLNSTVAGQLATSITNAKNSNPDQWLNTTGTISQAVNSSKALNDVNQAKEQNTPQLYSGFIRILFGNGAGATQFLQYQVLSPVNVGNFTQRVIRYLRSFNKLQAVSNIALYFVPDTTAGSRRRRGLNSAIGVSFNYNVSCVPVDTTCQTLGSTQNDITNGLNNVFDQFTPSPNLCYDSDSATNFRCLVGQADLYCRTSGASSATAFIKNLTICGSSPPIPGGGCVDYNPGADLISRMVVGNSTVCSPVAAASESGGGGGGLAFAGAGAGAAIVIIAIIIIIVMRRKKAKSTSGTSKRADDRTVVAFENPMYDDHTQNNQPVYDGGALHNDSEGLYDEPAFSASNKVNPVYQSNEDLTAGEGYLETGRAGGGGDGYLDVTPNVPAAEDVGYLGADEQATYENKEEEEPAYQDHKGLDPGYQESGQGFGFEDNTYAAAE